MKSGIMSIQELFFKNQFNAKNKSTPRVAASLSAPPLHVLGVSAPNKRMVVQQFIELPTKEQTVLNTGMCNIIEWI